MILSALRKICKLDSKNVKSKKEMHYIQIELKNGIIKIDCILKDGYKWNLI